MSAQNHPEAEVEGSTLQVNRRRSAQRSVRETVRVVECGACENASVGFSFWWTCFDLSLFICLGDRQA